MSLAKVRLVPLKANFVFAAGRFVIYTAVHDALLVSTRRFLISVRRDARRIRADRTEPRCKRNVGRRLDPTDPDLSINDRARNVTGT